MNPIEEQRRSSSDGPGGSRHYPSFISIVFGVFVAVWIEPIQQIVHLENLSQPSVRLDERSKTPFIVYAPHGTFGKRSSGMIVSKPGIVFEDVSEKLSVEIGPQGIPYRGISQTYQPAFFAKKGYKPFIVRNVSERFLMLNDQFQWPVIIFSPHQKPQSKDEQRPPLDPRVTVEPLSGDIYLRPVDEEYFTQFPGTFDASKYKPMLVKVELGNNGELAELSASATFAKFRNLIQAREAVQGVFMFLILICLWWWYAMFLGRVYPAKSIVAYGYDFLSLGVYCIAFRYWNLPIIYPATVCIASLLYFGRFGWLLWGLYTRRVEGSHKDLLALFWAVIVVGIFILFASGAGFIFLTADITVNTQHVSLGVIGFHALAIVATIVAATIVHREFSDRGPGKLDLEGPPHLSRVA
jgi:hypothetical protein